MNEEDKTKLMEKINNLNYEQLENLLLNYYSENIQLTKKLEGENKDA